MIDWLPVISSFAGLATFAAGGLAWYRSSVQKGYAAQRDFEHLRLNQQQMAEGQTLLIEEIRKHLRQQDKEFDSLHRELGEVKAMFYASIKTPTRE